MISRFITDRYELKIAFIYFLVSFLWIFYSDRLVDKIIYDPGLLLTLQTYKGWFFVLVSTFVLYFFIRRDAIKLRNRRKRIKELLKKEKDSRKQVEKEKEELEEILLEAPSAICILEGPNHRYTYANEEYQNLVGHRELMGKTVKEALPELQEQGFFDLLNKVYETGRLHKGYEVPFKIQHDEGEKTYYRNYFYKPLTDDKGDSIGIFVECVDVSKQVKNRNQLEKSNQEKQLLLNELHHRVKNNLALITGLIEIEIAEHQQSLYVLPLETIRNRIFAIAEIHEILFQQQSLKEIPFHRFLYRLRDSFFSSKEKSRDPNFEIKSKELKLNINQAVPFGLVINEVLSGLKNGNEDPPCEGIKLFLSIDDQNTVTTELHIQELKQQIREKLVNPDQHLPARLIQVLTQQLEAAMDYVEDNGKDVFKIRFQKVQKKGAASNI